VSSFLMSARNKKSQATAQLFHHHGSHGSLTVTHDPRDPSKNGDPFDLDT